MANELYFGIDESYDLRINENIATVLTISRDFQDILQKNKLEKKRYLDISPFYSEFLYSYENQKIPNLEIYMGLIHEAVRKYSNNTENIKIFIDGAIPEKEKIRSLCLHPSISQESLNFVIGGDNRLPLLNKADHLANMLNILYSNDPKKQWRIARFRDQYSKLSERLAECRIKHL